MHPMSKNLKLIVLAALSGIFLLSCVKEEDESSASIQKRILEAWLEVNYPNKDYEVTQSGLVILSHEKGEGESPENYQAAYIHYNVKWLDGNYKSTTDKDIAQMLGTYSEAKYYGPELAEIGYGKITEGLHEALCMMNNGSKMTIIIPPYLSANDYTNNYGYGYTSSKTETQTTNLIYEVEMEHVISNLTRFQTDSLEAFKNICYPGLDSTANGFYFKKLSGTSTDTISSGDKAAVWYVGRLLDGYVFDTNIEDTAKKYGLYDASSTYEALTVSYKSTYKEMSSSSDDNSNSSSTDGDGYVPGFAKALKSMTYGDHAITFFSSDWGYGSTSTMSSGSGVPAYSMLYFDIYVEKSEN